MVAVGQGLPVQLYFRFRWPSFDLFSCSSIDMCGFGIYVSGFAPVCTVRSIFRWFDCDLCKLDSFAFGSNYFWGVWIALLFGESIYFCAVRFIFVQVGFICTSFDFYFRGSVDFLRFWLYLNDFRFIFYRLIMFVHVSFCLFCDLKILAVTERHTLL